MMLESLRDRGLRDLVLYKTARSWQQTHMAMYQASEERET